MRINHLQQGLFLLLVCIPGVFPLFGQSEEHSIHFEKGIEAYEKNLLVDASVFFTEAISVRPDNAKAYYYRAECYNRMNQKNHALSDYQESLNYNPELLMPKIRLIGFYKDRKLHKQGIDITTQLIKYHPENIGAGLMERGYFHEASGDIKKAQIDYTRFLNLDDSSLDSLKEEIKKKLLRLSRS